jgi:hypothetical protein
MEGTQHRAFSARWRLRVIDIVDQKGQAEYVGEQDEFLIKLILLVMMPSS